MPIVPITYMAVRGIAIIVMTADDTRAIVPGAIVAASVVRLARNIMVATG
jgi:hypothetical protein